MRADGRSIIFSKRNMLPFHQVEAFLQHIPAHLQDIILELRNIITSVAPDAVEAVRWGGLSYYHQGRGGIVSAGICQVEIHKDQIHLGFIREAFLSDPHNLLKGTQKAKRFVRIETYEEAPWEYLKGLIDSAAKFDPRLIEKGRLEEGEIGLLFVG